MADKFALERHCMPEYPDLKLWAKPCVGCFRNENDAVWYFRAHHAGAIYTGIEGERKVRYLCKPLTAEEQRIYDNFHEREMEYSTRHNCAAPPGEPLPQLKIYPSKPYWAVDVEHQSVDYWMRRAKDAELKLYEIQEVLTNASRGY